MYQTIKIELS